MPLQRQSAPGARGRGSDVGFHGSRSLSGASSAIDSHFLNRAAQGYALDRSPKGASALAESDTSHLCHFSVFRADSVSVTSTQFAGGDWRWRLSDHEGATLVEAGGYRSEAHSREAVAILQAYAARATAD
jgi:uncharacterized protein YegP (UPF0339 family)